MSFISCFLSVIVELFAAKVGGYNFIALSHWEHDRCLLEALPVGYLLQMSTELLTTRATTASRMDVFVMRWVMIFLGVLYDPMETVSFSSPGDQRGRL